MTAQHIVMNFATPPSLDDLLVMASQGVTNFPEELLDCIEDLAIEVESFPDDSVVSEESIDDPFDCVAFYRSGKELYPGVEKKHSKDKDTLILYRRPLLDMWCETCEDLNALLRQIMIEEVARHFDFTEPDIHDMVARHH